MGPTPKAVLFLTSPEYGQANVVLATAQELARSADYHVHLASFTALQRRVDDINRRNTHLARPLTFVEIPGSSAGTTAQRQLGDTSQWAHPPGFVAAARSYKGVEYLLMGDSPREYMETYRACLQIMDDLKPAAVVCDILLIAAHDAIRARKLDYIVISPCSGKEVVGAAMPGTSMMLLRWPMQVAPLLVVFSLRTDEAGGWGSRADCFPPPPPPTGKARVSRIRCLHGGGYRISACSSALPTW